MTAMRTRDFRACGLAHLTLFDLALFLGCVIAWIVLLSLGAGGARAAELWSDISDAQWVADYGITAQQAGTVADGYPDGTFRPYGAVTRGQFAKMSVQGLGVETRNSSSASFSDVPRTHLFFAYVEGGSFAGIMGGYADGTFRPDRPIERQQSNSILGRFLAATEIEARGAIKGDALTYPSLSAWYTAEGAFYLAQFNDQGSIAEVHRPATAYLVYHDVVHGSNDKVTPTASLSRAQAVALVLRTVEAATDVTTPPPAPTGLETMPVSPSNNTRPYVIGRTITEGRLAIYDTFGGSTTEIAQGTADADGHFSVRTPALVEGLHNFTTKVKDDSGLISSASAAVAYLLDLTGPVGDITAPADGGGVRSRRPDFTTDAGDEGAGIASVVFEYRPAGSADDFATISTDTSAVGMEYEAAWGDRSLADGAYEFRVGIVDMAGNVTAIGPIDVIVDLQMPWAELQAPATPVPGGVFFTESGTPVFAAEAGDDPATVGAVASGVDRVDFLYQLKSALPALPADWTAAGFTLLSTSHEASALADWGTTDLADGHYVFAVRSFDLAGNESALDTQEVVVDSTPPIVTITAPAAGTKVRGDALYTITWTASDTYFGTDPIKIEYSADGDTWPSVALVEATANDGSFIWNVPAVDVPAAKIRITATDAMLRQTVVVSGAFAIDSTPPAAPTGVGTADNDNSQAGIDGRDFTVNWTPSVSAETVKQLIYILPLGTTLDPYSTAHSPVAAITDDTTATWTGTSGLTEDSAGAPFSPTLAYHVYVVAEDHAGNRTSSSAAVWPAGLPVAPSIIAGGDPGVAGAGVNGLDFTLSWVVSTSLDVIAQRVYILPAGTALVVAGLGQHTPVETLPNNTAATWTGTAALTTDSTGATLAAATYDLYVVALDDDGRSATSAVRTFAVAAP